MSTTEKVESLPSVPMPNGDPATWVYLDELPAPPGAAEEVERTCREYGWGRFWRWWYRSHLVSLMRTLKRIHYFWGKTIIFEQTPRGEVVTYAAEQGSDELFAYLRSLSPEQLSRHSRMSICDFNYPGQGPAENKRDEA